MRQPHHAAIHGLCLHAFLAAPAAVAAAAAAVAAAAAAAAACLLSVSMNLLQYSNPCAMTSATARLAVASAHKLLPPPR
eukprot:6201670-Pleurochrysis_carterae.AAC.1